MPYLFSPTKLAFFHTDLPYPDLPDDVQEVADDVHEAIMDGLLMRGKVLQADEQGAPVAEERAEAEPDAGDAEEEVPNSAQAEPAE